MTARGNRPVPSTALTPARWASTLGALLKRMRKKPLTTAAIILVLGDCYSVYNAIRHDSVDVFRLLVWVQGLVFLVLYLTRSSYAGAFLFYSVLPIYPLYVGSMALGLAPVVSPTVLGIMLAIYAAAVVSLWRLKRDYDRYYAARFADANGPV